MTKQNRSYTKEFKEEAIKLALSSVSISSAAKELGVPAATMYSWIEQAKKSGKQAVSSADGVVKHVNVAEVLEEVKSLKKQLKRLEQEKAILKKAAAYFAQELE